MNPIEFLRNLDENAVVDAIQACERVTRSEIRVFVTRHSPSTVEETMANAFQEFDRLGMRRDSTLSAVLIYLVPQTQKVAVVADPMTQEKVGQAFWNQVVDSMVLQLKAGKFQAAVLQAIGEIGKRLALDFPPGDQNPNELPDNIVRD